MKIKLPPPWLRMPRIKLLKSIEQAIPFILVIICVVSARFLGSELQVLAVFAMTLAIFLWRKYDLRILIVAALFLSIICTALLVTGNERYAIKAAIWTYYFLAIGALGFFIKYISIRVNLASNFIRSLIKKSPKIEEIIPFILIIICVAAAKFIASEIFVPAVFIITLAIYAWRKYDLRMLVGTALFLLGACVVLLAGGKEFYANEVAIWAYYFLVIGVLGLFIEYLREGRKHEKKKRPPKGFFLYGKLKKRKIAGTHARLTKIIKLEFRKHIHLIFYLVLSLVMLGILLKPGYILSLDMIFGPSPKPNFYGFGAPAFGGGIWLSQLASTWVIQKLFLILIFFLSGVSAYSLIETKSKIPRYFAGLLYMVNPFVYVRFLAGHWVILLAYAVTPFAIKYFLKFLDDPSKQNILKTLIPLVFVSVSSHVLILNLLAFLIIFCFKAAEPKFKIKKVIPRLALLALAFLAVNAYWIIPLATAWGETSLQQIAQQDLFVFAPHGECLSIPYSLATMYGFWRGGYTYTKDIFPAWHLFFFVILFLAIYGFISNYRNRRAQSLAAIGLISFFLAIGALGPLGPLFENITLLRGFRDSQKFVGLLVLAYAYLGALGVDSLLSRFKQDNKKILSISVVAIVLVTPIAYNFTQFGFWGQLQPTDYPADWYEANEILNADNQDFNILFLPWHKYMDFRFVPNQDKRIANPAPSFFDKPIISGQNLEVPGIYTQSTNPGQRYVENLLSSRRMNGEDLRLLNVKYVMLAKEVDYARYLGMLNASDLELVFDSENLMLYRNSVQVSRFYEADELSPGALEPLGYETISPAEYEVTGGDKRYTIFVPPNLDSSYWALDGKAAPEGFYAAWESRDEKVAYSRFEVYGTSYIISISSAIAIAAVCLIIWKKEAIWRKTEEIIQRLFKFRSGSPNRSLETQQFDTSP
jgi:hypothetical protein